MTLDDLARQAQFTAEGLLECALTAMRERVSAHGKLSAATIEAEQHAAHGLAWLATYVEAIKEMAAYARRMHEEGRLGPAEELLTRIGVGEYLAQMFGGIPMNQGEIVRLTDFGLSDSDIEPFRDEPVVEAAMKSGNTPDNRAVLVEKFSQLRAAEFCGRALEMGGRHTARGTDPESEREVGGSLGESDDAWHSEDVGDLVRICGDRCGPVWQHGADELVDPELG